MSHEALTVRQVFFWEKNNKLIRIGAVYDKVQYGTRDSKNESVSFRTFEFQNLPKEAQDGCDIRIKPGGSTPLQLIANDSLFMETPFSGDTIVTTISPEGEVNAYRFKASLGSNAGFTFELTKGWMVSLHAVNSPNNLAQVIEYCEPAFADGALIDVPVGAGVCSGAVPSIVWQFQDELSRGVYTCNCIPIVDLNKLEPKSQSQNV